MVLDGIVSVTQFFPPEKMLSLFTQIEQSGLATWLHESGSLWGYPLILFLHTLGLSTLVGINCSDRSAPAGLRCGDSSEVIRQNISDHVGRLYAECGDRLFAFYCRCKRSTVQIRPFT